jgi:outer membrane protein assembly factor BamB
MRHRSRYWPVVALVAALCISAPVAFAEDWPQYRGPTGMGISTETKLPLEWGGPGGKNVLWKTPLPATLQKAKPDNNQSSPIIWRGRVFVTTAFWPEKRPHREYPDQHVTCYSLADGKQIWDTPVPPGPWKLSDLRGGYSAPTPTTDGERVYVTFGSSVLAAIDWDGKLVWRKELPDWKSFDVAIASSPILYRGQLLVLADRNGQKSTLTAYDPKTGDVLWEKKRPGGAFDHTTPVIVEHGGRAMMLVHASNELQALDPSNGERLWWCKTPGDVTSPAYSKGLVYSDSGRGGPGLLVAADGKGDVTATHVKWKISQIPEGLSSPVIVGDYLYRVHNPSVLKCVAMDSGKPAYTERLSGISVPSSPIVTPDGRIYFASGGKSFVVQAGPKFELLATNELGEPSAASPAVSDGRMILKGQKHLFCVGHAARVPDKN